MTEITIEYKERPCTIGQPAKVGAKPSSCKSLPRKVPDVQDTGKSSYLIATGLYIDGHVGRNSCKILSSKTSPVHQESSKSSLGVR